MREGSQIGVQIFLNFGGLFKCRTVGEHIKLDISFLDGYYLVFVGFEELIIFQGGTAK